MKKLPVINLGLFAVVFISWVLGSAYLVFYPVLFYQPKFLLSLPFILIFFALLVVNPELALIIILLIRPPLDRLLNETRLGEGIGIGAAFNLAILLIFVILLFKNQGLPRNSPLNRWWVIFLLAILPAVFYSPFFMRAVRLYLNYSTYFALATLPFLIVKNSTDLKKYLRIFSLVFLIPLIVGIFDLASGGWYFTPDAGRRVQGAFTHPNIFAFLMVLGVSFYFFLKKGNYQLFDQGKMRWLFFASLFILPVLFGTKARSAWIACFIGFFIYGLLRDRKFLFILLLLSLGSVFVPQVHDRIVTLLSERGGPGEYQGLNSFVWRLQAWQTGFLQILKNPILGYGLTSFKPLSSGFSSEGEEFAIHNIYLELWFEAGIIGMVSYMVLLFTPLIEFIKVFRLKTSGRIKNLSAIMIGYVVGYLTVNVSDNLAYYLVFNWYYWFFVGLVIVGLKLEIQEERNKLSNP